MICGSLQLVEPVMRCVELAAGTAAQCWRIDTPERSLLYKQWQQPDSQTDVERMLILQQLAANAGLAPQALQFDHRTRASLSNFVVGQTWSTPELLSAAGQINLLGLIARLQAIPLPQTVCGDPKLRFDIANSLERRLAALAGSIAATEVRPWSLRLQHARHDLLTAEAPCRPVLLHLDIHAANVVLTPTGMVLLDWEYAAIGDPVWEFASILTSYPTLADEAVRLFAAAIDGRGGAVKRLLAARNVFQLLVDLWGRERSAGSGVPTPSSGG